MSEKPQKKIILRSSDQEQFEVDRDVIRLSNMMNTMLIGISFLFLFIIKF